MEKIKNHNRKLGKCICDNCGKEFEKPLSEINRNEKLKRSNFCSRSCVGKSHISNFGDKSWSFKTNQFKRQGDEFTKFKYYMKVINSRHGEKGLEVNVTLEDLKAQWDLQNGLCKFTGIELILSTHSKIINDPIYSASVDRIDSNIGYVKGNIVWVSRSINYMKNNMSDEMVWKLCNIICDNINKKRESLNVTI
jgi:hypothetical protein